MRILHWKYHVPLWLLGAALLVCLTASRGIAARSIEGTVPQAASALARQMDRQMAERFMHGDGVSLAVTVPVNINDLDESNPLARQMAEELARWFVQAGYNVQEIRKGRMLLTEPGNGEKLLTRRRDHLSEKEVRSTTILTGTYAVTNKNVRFSIRILHTATQDVLGMATVSVPITSEVKSMLGGRNGEYRAFMGIGPSVGTTLP